MDSLLLGIGPVVNLSMWDSLNQVVLVLKSNQTAHEAREQSLKEWSQIEVKEGESRLLFGFTYCCFNSVLYNSYYKCQLLFNN